MRPSQSSSLLPRNETLRLYRVALPLSTQEAQLLVCCSCLMRSLSGRSASLRSARGALCVAGDKPAGFSADRTAGQALDG